MSATNVTSLLGVGVGMGFHRLYTLEGLEARAALDLSHQPLPSRHLLRSDYCLAGTGRRQNLCLPPWMLASPGRQEGS